MQKEQYPSLQADWHDQPYVWQKTGLHYPILMWQTELALPAQAQRAQYVI